MKACIDCVYVQVKDPISTRCHHPKSLREIPDYLYGTFKTLARSIEHMRTLGECGHDAVLFEPKE